jgi:hypothetical protein
LDNLKESKKEVHSLLFDGVEVLTDIAFYLFYSYYKHSSCELWSQLKTVSLASCRHITDFGIELLYKSTGKTDLLNARKMAGCKKLFRYWYSPIDSEQRDIFLNDRFNKCAWPNAQRLELHTHKVYICNDTKFDLSKFISDNELKKKENALFNFVQTDLKQKNNQVRLNIIQVDSNFTNILNTANCISILCVENSSNLGEKLSEKLMKLFYQVEYRKKITLLFNPYINFALLKLEYRFSEAYYNCDK